MSSVGSFHSVGSLHGVHSIHSIHSQMNSLHRGSPPSLIQEALDAARARDIATTAALLLQSTSVGQEEQASEAVRARDIATTATLLLRSTSAGHTSPGLNTLQKRVSSPLRAGASHAVSHVVPGAVADAPQPSSNAKEQLPVLQWRRTSGSPESMQLIELRNLGHDHRRAHASSPLSSSSAGAIASADWEPGVANMGCSAVAFSKFLHMQHKYESMQDENEECLMTPDAGDASCSAMVPSEAMVQRAREECGSEDWGTHLDDTKAQAAAAKRCKRAREEHGSLNWGSHLDDLNSEGASSTKVARTDEPAAGPNF